MDTHGLSPYSRFRVLGLWLLATVPMVLVTWIVAPRLIPHLAWWPAAAVYLALSSLGMLWQGVLALWALRQEGVPLRWRTLRRRTWLQVPRHPNTGEPRGWRFLWLALSLPLALLPLLVGNVFTASWLGLRTLHSQTAIDLSPGYAKSLDLASPEFSGQWWLLALVLVAGALGAFAEEFLFRGVLLPRMNGTFGGNGWFANATLFALSYAHVPLMLPSRWLAALVTVWPARRWRSNWLSVAVRGGECAGLVAAALAGILTPSLPPLETAPAFPRIARRPPAADLSRHCRPGMSALPTCTPGQPFAVDLRSCDLSALDLRSAAKDAACALFDDRTVWPAAERMPSGFEPSAVLGTNANPGLGLRQLHAQGVTGRGVGIAIIDSFLLVDHEEYGRQLRWYEELPGLRSILRPSFELPAHMHGLGVASLAVGRTVGVAPDADLYFIATDTEDPRGLLWGAHFSAQGIRRIVQINRGLPPDRRIRAISISMGWGPECPGYDDVTAAVNEAAAAGIALFAIFIDGGFEGLGRPPESDPDRFDAYGPAMRWAADFHGGRVHSDHLWVPVDARTAASPTGPREHVFYRWGASSWIVPYLAGTYALAAQVDPTITRERFVALAKQTGRTNAIQHGGRARSLGPILDPAALIAALRRGSEALSTAP
jgi:membrane protease YdiL (CAAX protease family)